MRRPCIAVILLAAAALSPGHAAALLLSSPATAPVSESARRREVELSNRSADLIDQGKFAEAQSVLREALQLVPDNLTCHYNLACVYAKLNEPDNALDELEAATAAGFTDFRRIEKDPLLRSLHDQPRFRQLLARKGEIQRQAAEHILSELQKQFGPRYRYEIDHDHKLVFAVHLDERGLDALKRMLNLEALSEAADIFQHSPDEYIRIVIATPVDFRKAEHRPGVGGRYDDSTRTVLVKRVGPELRHEFTHALHAADQHAIGEEHPVWLSEGLATLFEYPREEGDGPDRRMLPSDTWRLSHVQAAARRNSLIPLDSLLKLDRLAFTARADLAYGEAGSLLMYLYDRGLLKKFYEIYVSDYRADPTGGGALEKTTGISLADLQAAWVDWLLPRSSPPRNAPEPLE